MDFDQAVAAHSSWKRKLSGYLEKHDGSLKAIDVGQDNKCPLGEWIYGEGSRHSQMAAYADLKKEHARFHSAAAEVVRHADSGQSTKEETALGSNSDFGKASAAVIRAIMAMKKCAGA